MARHFTELADAIATELEAARAANDIVAVFTAERRIYPYVPGEDLATTIVRVIGGGADFSLADRRRDKRDYRVDVGVLKSVSEDDGSEIDGLIHLVEDIQDHFKRLNLTLSGGATAHAIECEIVDFCNAKELRESRTFIGIVRMTYAVVS